MAEPPLEIDEQKDIRPQRAIGSPVRPQLIGALIAGVLFLLGAGVLFFSSVGLPETKPTPSPFIAEFTPPPSLVELVERYPRLAPLLTDPELDTAYKEFLIAYQEGGKEGALELARRRGLLTRQDEIRLTLILDTTNSGPLVAQLGAIGIRVIAVYQDRVDIAVPLAVIESQAQGPEPGAVFRQLTELEHVIALRVPALHAPQGSRIPGEGIGVIGADDWHRAGFTGAGVRIGILDMGFRGYQALLGEELPETVTVEYFGDWDPEEVHGPACAEIIHEIAPDAELFFAWYDGSDASEGEAVDWLLSQGVHIISHSAGAIIGPRDGTDWQSRLVDSVAARGVLWVNSSGNEALSHYRVPFTDRDGDGIHEFAAGQELMPLEVNNDILRVVLMWDDVWGRASQDYELYLTDREGEVLAASEDVQDGSRGRDPAEMIIYLWEGEDLYLAVKAYAADRTATIDIFTDGADVPYPSCEYSLVIPSDAVGALSVGATEWQRDTLADYSSCGPTADGRLKPEISAPTGVSGATYGNVGFEGTSASAPHVAGAAALVWQAYADFSRQQVIDFLLAHAVDRGPSGPDTGYGYGRLQLPLPPSVAAPMTPVPPSETVPPTETTPPQPLPTPTAVAYVVPTPVPPAAGVARLSPLAPIVGAMGCVGMSLVVGAGVAMIRSRRPPVSQQYGPPEYGPPVPPFPYPPVAPFPPPTPTPPYPSPTPGPKPPAPALCPHCGAPMRPGARFCSRCGQPLLSAPAACPQCGAPTRPGARFCSRCGQPLSSAPAACPHCGAPMRPGARFCSRCGRPV